jgi:putative flippase GtrA
MENTNKSQNNSELKTPLKKEENSEEITKKEELREKNLFNEIVRFVIIGVVCTLIDFGVSFAFIKVFSSNLATQGAWGGYLSFAIAGTISFLVSSLVNFIFSRIYVFKNVDENIKTNNQKTFWFFLILGTGGWLIGIALQELGVWICNVTWSLNLSLDVTQVSLTTLFGGESVAFWAFVVIFCIKTLVTLVYNYITRKAFIFKAPKKQ